jgi:PAS domain S-box-containing protein
MVDTFRQRVMEQRVATRHHGPRMDEAAAPSRYRSIVAVIAGAALVDVIVYLALPSGRAIELGSEAIVAASCLLAAGVLLDDARKGWTHPGTVHLGWGILLLGVTYLWFLVRDLSHLGGYRPQSTDALFLVFLVPLIGVARSEYRAHVGSRDLREIAVDVGLIAISVAAIAWIVTRPTGASGSASVSAATFSLFAALGVSIFGVLALLVPSRTHLMRLGIFVPLAIASLALGAGRGDGSHTGMSAFVDVAFFICPLAFAVLATWEPWNLEQDLAPETFGWARPALTTAALISGAAALAVVSILDGPRHVSSWQSAEVIVVLGLAIAARILMDQITSMRVEEEVHTAFDQKEGALREADLALGRAGEATETLKQSEEHLRLVFETAVDGIVELDMDDVILRANNAFCKMVNLDRATIEGQAWPTLAAATEGADHSFSALPATGQAQIQRGEGQPLYLESRISDVPTDPPRRLLLVRDVTARRVADQTIRSLFQFLQDRDEDRTRLLRRTNAAIEAERNRIARDLHDGPVQGVSAASLSLEAALLMLKAGDSDRGLEVLGKIRQELAEEADALRRLMSGLRPPVLEERGLIPAIRDTLSRFGEDNAVATAFDGNLTEPIPEDLETIAFRVVQEALSNVGKHANADRVSVSVESDASSLRIEIEDDGRGFDSSLAREFLRMGRVGLASMRERVELASGSFLVRSTPGRGTTIVAMLPVDVAQTGRELLMRRTS